MYYLLLGITLWYVSAGSHCDFSVTGSCDWIIPATTKEACFISSFTPTALLYREWQEPWWKQISYLSINRTTISVIPRNQRKTRRRPSPKVSLTVILHIFNITQNVLPCQIRRVRKEIWRGARDCCWSDPWRWKWQRASDSCWSFPFLLQQVPYGVSSCFYHRNSCLIKDILLCSHTFFLSLPALWFTPRRDFLALRKLHGVQLNNAWWMSLVHNLVKFLCAEKTCLPCVVKYWYEKWKVIFTIRYPRVDR